MKNLKIFLLVAIVLSLSLQAGYSQEQQQNSDAQLMQQIRQSLQTGGDNSADQSNNNNNRRTNRIKIDYWAYIRIIIVLALVIAAIYAIFRFMKKFLKIKDDVGEDAQIITSQTLGPNRWLQVVYIHGKYLILGVTNENINLISEITDPKEIERLDIYSNQQEVNKGSSFQELFNNLKNSIFGKKDKKDDFNYETDEVDFLKNQNKRFESNEVQEQNNDEN